MNALLASWKVSAGIAAGIGSFAIVPATLDYHRDWTNEIPMEAIGKISHFVVSLEVLDTRKGELISDRDDIEDNIKALELKLENPSIVGQHRKDLERQIESERKRLYQILQRLNQAIEYDQQIIEELEKSYS